MHSRIVGTGSYLPAQVLTNADLAQRVDTSDEWIVARTGIHERRIAAPGEQTSDLALHASRAALAGRHRTGGGRPHHRRDDDAGLHFSVHCVHPASEARRGGRRRVRCAGGLQRLRLCTGGRGSDGGVRHGEECARRWRRNLFADHRLERPRTCVLFGDGAGAVVLAPSPVPGILSAHLHADGRYGDILCVPGTIADGAVVGSPFVKMEGGAVFKLAVKVLADVAHEALAARGVTAAAIDWLVPHQANVRIIDATAKKLGVPLEKVITTVDRHANTSAASIPLALDEAVRDGRLLAGQHVMLLGVGGGFTWGSVFLDW
jgi:3-oxoacyl-[acyl-carrier-protein] synthase-3